MIGTFASKRGRSGRGHMRAREEGVGCGGKEVANERCFLLKLVIFLKSRHFSNVVAVDFSASSREYQLDGTNASKKLVSLTRIHSTSNYNDSDAIIIALVCQSKNSSEIPINSACLLRFSFILRNLRPKKFLAKKFLKFVYKY